MNPYDFVVKIYPYDAQKTTMPTSPFGARLRIYRMKKKLSLQQLADAIEASKAHVWDLEQGNTKNPSLELLTKLSRALDVPIKELVGESTEAEEHEAELAPLFRDLRGLKPEQLDLIRTMTQKLREMDDGDKSDGGQK